MRIHACKNEVIIEQYYIVVLTAKVGWLGGSSGKVPKCPE